MACTPRESCPGAGQECGGELKRHQIVYSVQDGPRRGRVDGRASSSSFRRCVLCLSEPPSQPPPFPLLPVLVAAHELGHHPVSEPPAHGVLVVHGRLSHAVHHGVLGDLSLERLVQLLSGGARTPAAALRPRVPLNTQGRKEGEINCW